MPKPTFENLRAAKQQAIIDIAIAEFAEYPYASASLSRIVARAGIAKGSIYQYFENKQDFFLYLLEYAANRQLALLRDFPPPEAAPGFFALLRWQMSASIRVGLAAPALMRLMQHAFDGTLPFQPAAERIAGKAGEAHLGQMLQQGIEQGELNPELDLALAAYVINQVMGDLGPFLVRRLGLSLEAVADDITQLDQPAVNAVFDSLVMLLRHGLAQQRNEQ
jgi:AcrR family transcriptional regulator